jgi:hypothetical protein
MTNSSSSSNRVKVVFATLRLADVEDPEIYAAGPLMDWQKTEMGQWCMENSLDQPHYTIIQDYATWGYTIKVVGILMEKDFTYFSLKWGQQ